MSIAANRVGYHMLGAAALRELFADPCVSMFMLAQMSEARWRSDRLAASIGRLDAHARLCVLLLDIHDRLRHRELINRPTFNLPLTQEQIADHLGLTLVHVNRTLRRLREEKIVLVDRQVVIIQDIERLRELAQGLPQAAELPEVPATPERAGIARVRDLGLHGDGAGGVSQHHAAPDRDLLRFSPPGSPAVGRRRSEDRAARCRVIFRSEHAEGQLHGAGDGR